MRSTKSDETLRAIMVRTMGALKTNGAVETDSEGRDFLQASCGQFLLRLHPEPDYAHVIVCHRRYQRIMLSACIHSEAGDVFDKLLNVTSWDRSAARRDWHAELIETFHQDSDWLLVRRGPQATTDVYAEVLSHIARLRGSGVIGQTGRDAVLAPMSHAGERWGPILVFSEGQDVSGQLRTGFEPEA